MRSLPIAFKVGVTAMVLYVVGTFVLSMVGTSAWWALALVGLSVSILLAFLVERMVGDKVTLVARKLENMANENFNSDEASVSGVHDELTALVETANETSDRFQEKIDSLNKIESYRKDFLGNVSHELKTPIFAIRGYAETLLGGAIDDENVNREFVERIFRNANRMEKLAADLSVISQIETGELPMRMTRFDARALAYSVTESLQSLADAKEITLQCNAGDAEIEAFGDENQLEQLLTNLIENALKYTDSKGSVMVSARPVSGSVKFSVADNGVGISAQHIPRLTERFYRVDTSRSRQQGGTGLGLAIAKHILQAHGSVLEIDSTPGHGSTFSFHIRVPETIETGIG